LARTTRAGGRSVTIYAEELGGTDLISANVYRTVAADHLRACEMPAAKVLAFLRGWTPARVAQQERGPEPAFDSEPPTVSG
jgi:hypothetical protein